MNSRRSAAQAALAGGLWLWKTRSPSGLVMVVVPPALSAIVLPHR
jgi:hypothetical protein